MKWQRVVSYFCYILIPSFLLITGCSKPILKMPESLPPMIKEYKHLTISGYKNLKHTGIYINKEDIYSILVTGKISNPYQDASNWTLQARIGKENPNLLPRFIYNTYTGRSQYSGYLYVGTEVEKYFQDITGSFSVDIIVWEREDYVQIADFFEKMKEKDPTNKAINDAFYEANSQKMIYLASKKASKIIEETKKKIQELEEGLSI